MTKYKAYMCSTDFHTEWVLDPKAECPELFKTIAELKRKRTCWKECGIVEVEVRLVKSKTKGKRGYEP